MFVDFQPNNKEHPRLAHAYSIKLEDLCRKTSRTSKGSVGCLADNKHLWEALSFVTGLMTPLPDLETPCAKSRLLSYIACGRRIWRYLLASASYVKNDIGERAFVVVPCEIAED